MTQLLRATGLEKVYPLGRKAIGRPQAVHHAVQGVDLVLDRGETLAVVGESGAGKSTVGRILLRLIEPDAGTVTLNGVDLLTLGVRDLRNTRKQMQMIFQDPYSSLDPRLTVAESVAHPLRLHFDLKDHDLRERVLGLLDRVGINARQANRLPHEFSGGQLQRVAIARALAVEPDLIVCDEPVAALDVSIRAQVVNLLDDLQSERGVAYVFISHDLSLVRAVAKRVMIMYLGRVVEEGPTAELFAAPKHPYTKVLLDAIPVPDPRLRSARAEAAKPLVVSRSDSATSGCSYAPRCPLAVERCWVEQPQLRVFDNGAAASCHLVDSPPTADLTMTKF